MVMKVSNISVPAFRAGVNNNIDIEKTPQKQQIKELSNVTPDFGVNLPQKYSKLGVITLDNGLQLHQYKLANGYRVTVVQMEDSPAVVKNYVNVGSMNETADIKGISHFLEHMAFNGTNGENGHIKLEVGDSFRKIDEMGGWANASTNYAITDYVNSTPMLNKGDLERQIEVIAAMTEDLKLADDMIKKEKGPVSSEINMILDDPQTIAMDQSIRTLFNIKNPADEMVGGSVKHIKNLTREDVVNYYNKYYTPDNMNLVITGDVNPDEAIKIVAKKFNSGKISKGRKFEEKLSPLTKTVRKDFVSDKALSTEIILSFAGPKNSDTKEKILYEAAQEYLNSYSSGLQESLKKLNTYPYIGSEKVSTNPNSPRMIYMAMSTADSNTEKAIQSVYDVISGIKEPTEEQLDRLKQKMLKDNEELMEYSAEVNDLVGKAVLDNDMDYITEYNKVLREITSKDVINAVNRYFDLNKTAITVVHPKKTDVSFKGRKPVKTEKISEYRLSNNFDVGFYETKSSNINYNTALCLNTPYNAKPGVIQVLNEIYTMGTANRSEEEFEGYKDANNIELDVAVKPSSLKIYSESGFDNRELVYNLTKEVLYNPNINEKTLEKAKENVRDGFERMRDTAYKQYLDYASSTNPYDFSTEEILNGLDNITVEDVENCHKYFLQNARGIITANLPTAHKEEVKQEVINNAGVLNKVQPNNYKVLDVYKAPLKPIVLTKENNNSQADIMQVYRFPCDGSVKENVTGEIMNSILSNSSIGLFDVLREKENLAYTVYSSIDKNGNCGELSCNILTTTDNKEIGEISYDNVQKSINGFTRRINALKNGEFTDKDLENAKLALKAHLLEKEGNNSKLYSISMGLNSEHGITYMNKLYNAIDSVTRDDILLFADKVFKNPPIYSIVASKDTLDANKDYFAGLEQ